MRVTSDEIERAKEIPLIDFIDANKLDYKKEGKSYRLTDNDSMVITDNKYYWNSQDTGGYGAISFAMTYYDLKFPQAVKRVNNHEYGQLTNVEETSKKPFSYPKHFETKETKETKDYLVHDRKIDERVVDWCMRKDLLVQDMKKNAVFKWKDENGKVVGGDRQGTTSIDTKRGTYKNIIPSSKEDGGFTINVGKKPNKIAVFESPIDMLSYWSVHKDKVQDTKMVSMSGLKIKAVAGAMKEMKNQGNNIDEIISCVDNDKAGNDFHKKMERIFSTSVLKDGRPGTQKDWNAELQNTQSKTKPKQNEQAQGM